MKNFWHSFPILIAKHWSTTSQGYAAKSTRDTLALKRCLGGALLTATSLSRWHCDSMCFRQNQACMPHPWTLHVRRAHGLNTEFIPIEMVLNLLVKCASQNSAELHMPPEWICQWLVQLLGIIQLYCMWLHNLYTCVHGKTRYSMQRLLISMMAG